MENLSPKELYKKQKAAFKKGNMKLVKEIGQIARKRLKRDQLGDWEEAKKAVFRMEFPKDIVGQDAMPGESHRLGRKKIYHDLKSYQIHLKPVLGYTLEAKYNFCPECNEIRNQLFILYNHAESKCYIRRFIYHGKEVDE